MAKGCGPSTMAHRNDVWAEHFRAGLSLELAIDDGLHSRFGGQVEYLGTYAYSNINTHCMRELC